MNALRHIGAGALAGGIPLAGVVLGKTALPWVVAHASVIGEWAGVLVTMLAIAVAAGFAGTRQ